MLRGMREEEQAVSGAAASFQWGNQQGERIYEGRASDYSGREPGSSSSFAVAHRSWRTTARHYCFRSGWAELPGLASSGAAPGRDLPSPRDCAGRVADVSGQRTADRRPRPSTSALFTASARITSAPPRNVAPPGSSPGAHQDQEVRRRGPASAIHRIRRARMAKPAVVAGSTRQFGRRATIKLTPDHPSLRPPLAAAAETGDSRRPRNESL